MPRRMSRSRRKSRRTRRIRSRRKSRRTRRIRSKQKSRRMSRSRRKSRHKHVRGGRDISQGKKDADNRLRVRVTEPNNIEESQVKFYDDLGEFLDILKERGSREQIMYITEALFKYLSTTPYPWEDDINVRPIVLQLINNTARASKPNGRRSTSGMLLYSLVSHRLHNEIN
jgi:hypothetical protein